MKKLPVYTFVLILGLYGCSSQKKMVEQAPFLVENPTCQESASGRPEGGSWLTLTIPLDGLPSNVRIKQVYFRGHEMDPKIEVENETTLLVCEFRRPYPEQQKNLVMHADPMEEVGNQPPALLGEKDKEFPFELGADEAVIEFNEAGKRKSRFFKISGIKEKMPVLYPSRPKN